MYESIDAAELAKRWNLPFTWIRNHSREGYTDDPIPHRKAGRYVRFDWGSPELMAWWERRKVA
jgi:hypothetical protein